MLRHAEKIGDVAPTCRYFGADRSSFDRGEASYDQHNEAGLNKQKTHFKKPRQPHAARARREGLLPTKQISPGLNEGRVITVALSRHENL